MSRTDERIRSRVRGATLPVGTDGVVERIVRRRARRRVVRRAGVVTIVVVAFAASGATVYGLSRVIGPAAEPASGDTGVPTPSPTGSPGGDVMPSWVCDLTDIDADVDGDGVADRVVVDTVEPCAENEPGRYELRVQLGGKNGVVRRAIPECETPWLCHVFAAPDVDADGRAEIAVQTGWASPSDLPLSLYRFDETDGFQRLEVGAPGDDWDPELGLRAGTNVFDWGFADEGVVRWMSCGEDPLRRLAVMTAVRSEADPNRYDVHGTILELDRVTLVPAFSWDEEIAASRLDLLPTTFCGSSAGAEYEG
jgi:hypothetical protein